MDTLHAPTVPSGPTSNFSERNGDIGNQSFAELQRKKDDLEAELKALGSVLDSVGSKTPPSTTHIMIEPMINKMPAWC